MADHYVNLVTRVVTPSALTEEQVRKCTFDDPTLQAVIQNKRDNRLYEIGRYDGQSGVKYNELLVYHSVKEEITVNDSGGKKRQTCDSEKSPTTSIELSP